MKKWARVWLVVLVLAAAMLACVDWTGGGGEGGSSSGGGEYATATYGAEQWHAQLTALAK